MGNNNCCNKDYVLNAVFQYLAYSDPEITDNPYHRAFDWTRRNVSIPISNPFSNKMTLAPGQSATVFNGVVANSLNGSSVVQISLVNAQNSVYRMQVTAGPSGFKTARSPSGITTCTTAINNNSVETFTFTGATLNDVAVGDIMRISGAITNDQGPFAFNPLNAGLWSIIGIQGTTISCVRLVGQPFSGAVETVSPQASDLQFYATDGIQDGYKMAISGTFSVVSQRTFVVSDATPTWIDFVSTVPLPQETGLTYIPNSIVIYSAAKRFIAIEVDQDAVVRLNGDTSNNCVVNPIAPGKKDLVGSFIKWGNAYSCVVVNTSINSLNLKFWTGE